MLMQTEIRQDVMHILSKNVCRNVDYDKKSSYSCERFEQDEITTSEPAQTHSLLSISTNTGRH